MRATFWKLIRALLFRLEAENAHRLTLFLIRFMARFGPAPLRVISGSRLHETKSISLSNTVFDLVFHSRVGLAAGFDKNAEILTALPALGFGFAEVGTVTPRPQGGNPRPRLFRDRARESLFNRMGFNGMGAELVARNVAEARVHLPPDFRLGVNLGKNKDTPNESAFSDYVQAAKPFAGLVDYLVVNVSSPNTPGLRALQDVESLKPILEAVKNHVSGWKKAPPVLLKLAPELFAPSDVELERRLESIEGLGVDGWVLTNTIGGELATSSGRLSGGWSGGILTESSRLALTRTRAMSRAPIISVGGILSVEEAVARRRLGADLIQIYSGWIFRGPGFPAELSQNTG